MDKKFLNFWGNAFLNMARSQEQMEAMTKWMGAGMPPGGADFSNWIDLFSKTYGLAYAPRSQPPDTGDADEAHADTEAWQRSIRNFQSSLRQYFDMLGVVPKSEHVELIKKYEALKEKVDDMQETIRHLRMQTGTPETDGGDTPESEAVVKDFQRMISQQTRQFQELMNAAQSFFNPTGNAPETAPDTTPNTSSGTSSDPETSE